MYAGTTTYHWGCISATDVAMANTDEVCPDGKEYDRTDCRQVRSPAYATQGRGRCTSDFTPMVTPKHRTYPPNDSSAFA